MWTSDGVDEKRMETKKKRDPETRGANINNEFDWTKQSTHTEHTFLILNVQRKSTLTPISHAYSQHMYVY